MEDKKIGGREKRKKCNATRMRNLQHVRIREGIITEPSPNLSRGVRYEIGMASRASGGREEEGGKKESANTRSRCMWSFSG